MKQTGDVGFSPEVAKELEILNPKINIDVAWDADAKLIDDTLTQRRLKALETSYLQTQTLYRSMVVKFGLTLPKP